MHTVFYFEALTVIFIFVILLSVVYTQTTQTDPIEEKFVKNCKDIAIDSNNDILYSIWQNPNDKEKIQASQVMIGIVNGECKISSLSGNNYFFPIDFPKTKVS